MTPTSGDRIGERTVRVLGPLGVTYDGIGVDVPSRRQRALLAALAVRGRAVPVGDLLDAVWDDDPPERARTTLQTYVSRVRTVLGRDAVVHGPAGYALGPAVATDVSEVRAGVADLSSLDRADHVGRAELALDLLDRWNGRALAEFDESEWFRGSRVELDETWANLVDVAAEALIELGRAPQAIALLDAGVDRAPWREPSQVLLVRALCAAGRTTDAVRSASAYRRALGEETGLVPGRAFDAAEADALLGEDAAPVVRVPTPVASTTTALPRPTPLVGRAGALDELREAIGRSRVVSVVGPGGIGKTRLVAEVLTTVDRDTVVVELAPVEPGSVAVAVATAFGVRAEQPSTAVVAERLHGSNLMLVLDNAEHVIDEVRSMCRVITDRCAGVDIVVTSRERIGLADEIVLGLEPLPTDGARSDGVLLFLDRVRRAGPRHEIDDSDPSIPALCAGLDGVPLALELAASRAAVLGIADLARLLGEVQLGLIDVDDGQGRHGTLGNVVSWSVGLLGVPGQRLLAALSVFRGEFDLDGAAAVGSTVISEPVAVVLGRLVDTSLVQMGSASGRFRMLDMVRRFASASLADLESEAEVRRAHARWVLSEVATIDSSVPGPDETSVVGRIDAIRHEARSALRWSLDSGDVSTAGAIAAALAGPMLYRPDLDLVEEILRISGVDSLRGARTEAAALAAGARAAFLVGDLDAVEVYAGRAIEAGRVADPGAASAASRARHAIGVVALYQGRFADAASEFELVLSNPDSTIAERLDALGGVALARCYVGDQVGARDAVALLDGFLVATPSPTYRAFAEYARGEIALASGDVDTAATSLREAADRAWSVGASFVWGVASTVLAGVLVHHRSAAEARAHLPELVERWRRTATWPQLWTTLRLVAEHLAATGEPVVARLIIEAADRDASAPSLTGDDRLRYDALRTRLDDELGTVATGTVAAAAIVDRTVVLERALEALRASDPPVG